LLTLPPAPSLGPSTWACHWGCAAGQLLLREQQLQQLQQHCWEQRQKLSCWCQKQQQQRHLVLALLLLLLLVVVVLAAAYASARLLS
jgi:hypothetical protein